MPNICLKALEGMTVIASNEACAEADILIEEMFDLTLFVRDAYSLEYIIVRCSGSGR